MEAERVYVHMSLAARSHSALTPGGAAVRVPWSSRREYLEAVENFKLEECALQTEAIRRGLATQVMQCKHVLYHALLPHGTTCRCQCAC